MHRGTNSVLVSNSCRNLQQMNCATNLSKEHDKWEAHQLYRVFTGVTTRAVRIEGVFALSCSSSLVVFKGKRVSIVCRRAITWHSSLMVHVTGTREWMWHAKKSIQTSRVHQHHKNDVHNIPRSIQRLTSQIIGTDRYPFTQGSFCRLPRALVEGQINLNAYSNQKADGPILMKL